jgi:hypothetical protein
MTNLLLIGAGFSRNWGGWLAAEAFEHLLGSPEVSRYPEIRKLLWKHQDKGGFEAALAELQAQYTHTPESARVPLMALQDAVKRMFDDMNAAFVAYTDWQFGQQDIERQIGTFLTRFDAIFTLNQDILLEHHYINSNIALIGKKKWAGSELPGMRPTWSQDPLRGHSWSHATWSPLPKDRFKVSANCQPIYKLHGSSNWTREDGEPLLIMGGAKDREIGLTPILNWYANLFEDNLLSAGAKLMIIGYSFKDDHINASITLGVKHGLKLFIVDPNGSDLIRQLNPTRSPGHILTPSSLEKVFEESLIGASRRGMSDIFGIDHAEFSKVMRFFQD